MKRYPPFLIWLERALAEFEHPAVQRFVDWLATRRLNSVIGGLLQSLWMQAYSGSFRVTVEKKEGESEKDHDLRRLAAQADHAVGALATIQLYVYNELRQRGRLDLIEAEPEEEPEDVGGLTRIAWSCPVCGGPGDPMPGGRWGCSDGHPAVWDDGHGAQVQILPTTERP